MTDRQDETRAAGVREALRMVIDPELGENVVDLGLIYQVSVGHDGTAHIEMTTTTRACPATGYLKDAVESAAWIVTGIHSVEILLTYEPPWTPEMMNAGAKSRLGLVETGSNA
ncbi:metal-sulfur cluster assembly factor [Mesorhizobium sp. B1-1-6]|uniref:metal-sulfur cluster assembly factor n=1 Tax=Mesorhizobium sp. B1-1-6 TaxID=2589978 RepID=UPI00112E6399|nr:metal-sulfur cluster assembly factor [Mesorhizobium sp. B1-1-6]TPN35235.1 metal-sulfur cluster assembly factor [Mesorhizobium sp. B1-1-6]